MIHTRFTLLMDQQTGCSSDELSLTTVPALRIHVFGSHSPAALCWCPPLSPATLLAHSCLSCLLHTAVCPAALFPSSPFSDFCYPASPCGHCHFVAGWPVLLLRLEPASLILCSRSDTITLYTFDQPMPRYRSRRDKAERHIATTTGRHPRALASYYLLLLLLRLSPLFFSSICHSGVRCGTRSVVPRPRSRQGAAAGCGGLDSKHSQRAVSEGRGGRTEGRHPAIVSQRTLHSAQQPGSTH